MHFEDESGNLINNLDSNPIYIICHPYSNNPTLNFQRCVDIVRFMRSIHKLKVFSSILHTHQYDLNLKKHNKEYCENYYQWDLDLYYSFPTNTVMVFTKDYLISKGCLIEIDWAKEHKRKIIFVIE